ncbi:hypothetical protein [Haloarchaeobius sp. HRN-SO-5]|uniref:DUF7846 domain-containing protein n=1 Tax=Haloarchaeobius sp. HRN-SO-5 TaxID=3446118 RepID=UPI003EBA1DBA
MDRSDPSHATGDDDDETEADGVGLAGGSDRSAVTPQTATRLGPTRDLLRRRRVPTLLLAALTAVVVFSIATDLFPYHSSNHDEGVYLQQAAMLLDGQVRLHPPSGLVDPFRPWFFVVDGGALYPKYAPVPSAMFAVGMLFGEPRLALAAIAAGVVALTVALGTEAFDRRVGLLAGVVLLLTPTFLLSSSVFLPYVPTTLLNLTFALAYVRAHRRGSVRYAAVAGAAVALAFFARPYTAVLFALPFVAHACWTLWTASTGRHLGRYLRLNGVVATLGLVGVAAALGYNWALTGDQFVFPYAAFAPLDGLGFGQRRILGHELVYTPELALRTNLALVVEAATRWTVGGWLGTAAFLGGVGAWVARKRGSSPTFDRPHCSDDAVALLVLAVVGTVVVGNVAFWGTYNATAGPASPGDGLVALFGPFYHFDVFLPLSVFGAFGVVTALERLHAAVAALRSRSAARVVLAVVLLVSVPFVGVAEKRALDDPVDAHAATTAKYDRVYDPLEARSFDDAVVFVPTPYGDWLAHPFQHLRNGPGFDGSAVYALDRGASSDFAVVDAYPNRTYYRWSYRGSWTPDPGERPTPKLERLDVRSGDTLRGTTRVAVPAGANSAIVRLEGGGEVQEFAVDGTGSDRLAVNWTLSPDGLRVDDGSLRPIGEGGGVPLNGSDELAVAVVLTYDGGATLTYRQEFDARVVDGTGEESGVEVVWPPEQSVCRLVTDCGLDGTYLPEHPDEHVDGVWMNGTVGRVTRET